MVWLYYLYLLCNYFMGIVLIVAQNLLNVNDLWAGVPCNATAY